MILEKDVIAAEELANAHWEYIEKVLKQAYMLDHQIDQIGFHYKSAFLHGFKHGIEYMEIDKK